MLDKQDFIRCTACGKHEAGMFNVKAHSKILKKSFKLGSLCDECYNKYLWSDNLPDICNLLFKTRVETLVEDRNFSKLYSEFERAYNKYPVQMSRSEAFSKAYYDGLVDGDTCNEAKKYFGNLWSYVGD